MPEPDVADMEGFLSHIELVLPVLGFRFLDSPGQSYAQPLMVILPKLHLFLNTLPGIATAKAQEIDGEFVVLKGSTRLPYPKIAGPVTADFEIA